MTTSGPQLSAAVRAVPYQPTLGRKASEFGRRTRPTAGVVRRLKTATQVPPLLGCSAASPVRRRAPVGDARLGVCLQEGRRLPPQQVIDAVGRKLRMSPLAAVECVCRSGRPPMFVCLFCTSFNCLYFCKYTHSTQSKPFRVLPPKTSSPAAFSC